MMETPVGSGSDFTQHVAVETPEHVMLEFELAGLGSRAAAALLDMLLLLLLLVTVALATVIASPRKAPLDTWVLGIVILTMSGIFWGYFVMFETIWSGRRLGKRE